MDDVSPTPITQQEGQMFLSFPAAMQSVIEGKHITRASWNDPNTYGLLRDGFLMINTQNEFHRWLVSDGDMFGDDWIVLPESN